MSLHSTARVLKPAILVAGLIALLALPAQAIPQRHDDPTGNKYTEALNILYANGWHDVSDLQRNGDTVHAVAIGKDGQRVPVTVDLSAGTILAT
jgi:hypothetical protein